MNLSIREAQVLCHAYSVSVEFRDIKERPPLHGKSVKANLRSDYFYFANTINLKP